MFVRDLDLGDYQDFVGLEDCRTALSAIRNLDRKVIQLSSFVISFSADSSSASHGRQYSRPTAQNKEQYLRKQLNNAVHMLLNRHCQKDHLLWTSDRWEDLLYDLLASFSSSFDDFRERRKDLSRIAPVYSPSYWPDYWVVPHAHWANKKYNR